MHVLVTGGAGMLGSRLAARLLAEGLGGRPLARLDLADAVAAPPPAGTADIRAVVGDLAAPGVADGLVADRPDVVYHLAAVVSGEAEADLAKGYRVNLDGTRALLDAILRIGDGYRPRVVMTSSIAVFGAPLPDVIGDDEAPHPLTSYGTQKAICELLVDDLSRRGAIDGVSLRLPTICVRPGGPNAAASGFFSSILREPLAGREVVLPVPDDARMWLASPRAAVGCLVHAGAMDTAPLGQRRALTMPGVAATVASELDALRRLAGDVAVALVRREPDPAVMRIVAGWPGAFDPRRALALGFVGDADVDALLRAHVEDDLGGRIPLLEGAAS